MINYPPQKKSFLLLLPLLGKLPSYSLNQNVTHHSFQRASLTMKTVLITLTSSKLFFFFATSYNSQIYFTCLTFFQVMLFVMCHTLHFQLKTLSYVFRFLKTLSRKNKTKKTLSRLFWKSHTEI